jgi:transposase
MFQDRKHLIDQARRRFERELTAGSANVRSSGEEYLARLSDYREAFEHGPAADPEVARVDTTGAVRETEGFADWVWQESRRVRHLLMELPGAPPRGVDPARNLD